MRSTDIIAEKRHIKKFSFSVENITEQETQQVADMAAARISCGAVFVFACIVLVTVKAEIERFSSDEEVDAIRNDALAEDHGEHFQDSTVEDPNSQYLLL